MMQGLLSAEHRINLCKLACKSSDFIMVDPWEVFSLFCSRTSLCKFMINLLALFCYVIIYSAC